MCSSIIGPGNIFRASNNASELLGEYLVRRSVISREELDFALAVLPRYGGRMGDTLISLGLVGSLDIFRAIRDQGRDRLVDLEIRVQIIQYNAERTVGDILARGEAGAASSVSRLLITAFEQDIHEFALDLLGPAGLLGKSAPQAVQRSRWLTGFLRTRASTIGAGTREIQLNTVAEQVLGLPHDPGMPPR